MNSILSYVTKLRVSDVSKVLSKVDKAIPIDKKTRILVVVGPLLGYTASEVKHSGEKKKQQEKELLYQEMLRKHQAVIDLLKNEKEREEYRERLRASVAAKEV